LRDEGSAKVFITHEHRELRAVANRITVIRHGKVMGDDSPTASDGELASLMVGRSVELTVQKDAPTLHDNGLEVTDLVVTSELGIVVVDDVSFEVRGGEVLAIAGLQGNGQTELTEALLGL